MKKPLKMTLIAAGAAVLIAVGSITAVSVHRSSPEYALSSAERYLSEMNYEQAVIEFEKYLEIDPKNDEVWLMLADTYEKMGEDEKVKDVLERAVEEADSHSAGERLKELEEKENEETAVTTEITEATEVSTEASSVTTTATSAATTTAGTTTTTTTATPEISSVTTPETSVTTTTTTNTTTTAEEVEEEESEHDYLLGFGIDWEIYNENYEAHPNRYLHSAVIGEKWQLEITEPYKSVEWVSKNPFVAEVDKNGLVTILRSGTAEVGARVVLDTEYERKVWLSCIFDTSIAEEEWDVYKEYIEFDGGIKICYDDNRKINKEGGWEAMETAVFDFVYFDTSTGPRGWYDPFEETREQIFIKGDKIGNFRLTECETEIYRNTPQNTYEGGGNPNIWQVRYSAEGKETVECTIEYIAEDPMSGGGYYLNIYHFPFGLGESSYKLDLTEKQEKKLKKYVTGDFCMLGKFEVTILEYRAIFTSYFGGQTMVISDDITYLGSE